MVSDIDELKTEYQKVPSITEIAKINDEIRECLRKANEKSKFYYDQKAQEAPNFKIGDLVLLKERIQRVLANNRKARYVPYAEPFKIVGKSGDLSYRLDLKEMNRQHFRTNSTCPNSKNTMPENHQLLRKTIIKLLALQLS